MVKSVVVRVCFVLGISLFFSPLYSWPASALQRKLQATTSVESYLRIMETEFSSNFDFDRKAVSKTFKHLIHLLERGAPRQSPEARLKVFQSIQRVVVLYFGLASGNDSRIRPLDTQLIAGPLTKDSFVVKLPAIGVRADILRWLADIQRDLSPEAHRMTRTFFQEIWSALLEFHVDITLKDRRNLEKLEEMQMNKADRDIGIPLGGFSFTNRLGRVFVSVPRRGCFARLSFLGSRIAALW